MALTAQAKQSARQQTAGSAKPAPAASIPNGQATGTFNGVCPHCGYCPHCGRGNGHNWGIPYQPYWGTITATSSVRTCA
jgi:hypothetical protein